jgi:transforming growth factor-beta-induced protein
VQINNATVVTADVIASNGVIHVIDTVLLPNE